MYKYICIYTTLDSGQFFSSARRCRLFRPSVRSTTFCRFIDPFSIVVSGTGPYFQFHVVPPPAFYSALRGSDSIPTALYTDCYPSTSLISPTSEAKRITDSRNANYYRPLKSQILIVFSAPSVCFCEKPASRPRFPDSPASRG